jgi:ABC-type branched-subunit amino acid transport system ATPase component
MNLEIDNLCKHFGGVTALDDVSLDFPAGQVTAVIGPNGAGKTTLFNVVAGFVSADHGVVRIVEQEGGKSVNRAITGLPPHKIAQAGVGVLFQDIRIFGHLSALENVAVGAGSQLGERPLAAVFRDKSVSNREREVIDDAYRHLDFIGLADKAHVWAGNLSYGQQKLVAIARLLAADSRILLLDEPTSGIHPDMIQRLLKLIAQLASDQRRAVIMVEHNLNVVREVGDWIYLMARGRVEIFGKPAEVLRDESIVRLFPTL